MTVKIYEPLYSPGQTLNDEGYAPLVHRNDRPHWRELQFFVDMLGDGLHREHDLVGLFSPKFYEKTLLTSSDVRTFIEQNPGGEVYTFVSHPQMPYFMYNVWTNGEDFHPGLLRAAQALMDAVGLPFELDKVGRHSPEIWCMCNFWVGSTKFWDAYVGEVLRPIAAYIQHHPDHPAVQAVLTVTSPNDTLPFLPFIVERLFTTFLGNHPEWRSRVRQHVAWNAPRCLPFEHDVINAMRDRIDRADAENYFPPDLIATMTLLRRLRIRFDLAYYATHPHPTTGRVLDDAWIERALASLEK